MLNSGRSLLLECQGSSVVEQRTHKPLVGCSNHLPGTIFLFPYPVSRRNVLLEVFLCMEAAKGILACFLKVKNLGCLIRTKVDCDG